MLNGIFISLQLFNTLFFFHTCNTWILAHESRSNFRFIFFIIFDFWIFDCLIIGFVIWKSDRQICLFDQLTLSSRYHFWTSCVFIHEIPKNRVIDWLLYLWNYRPTKHCLWLDFFPLVIRAFSVDAVLIINLGPLDPIVSASFTYEWRSKRQNFWYWSWWLHLCLELLFRQILVLNNLLVLFEIFSCLNEVSAWSWREIMIQFLVFDLKVFRF